MRQRPLFEDCRLELTDIGKNVACHRGQGTMARKYFGTDGIRGRANGVITPELALQVGQAAGLSFTAASTATAC